jgi:hypothetical protein
MASTPPTSIPNWLLRRLEAASEEPPRYEASLYGPINSILATYFPPQQRFMVKPQGKVRPGYEYDIGEVERQSFDSYNTPVQPRGRGQGDEADVKIPDFIVVKGSETMSDDIPLLIVEVKRDDSDDAVARLQLFEYMEAFSEKIGNVKFKAALVQGSKVSIYTNALRHNMLITRTYRCSSMNGALPLLSYQHSRSLRLSLISHF